MKLRVKCIPTKMFGIPAPKIAMFNMNATKMRIRLPYTSSATAAYGHLPFRSWNGRKTQINK